MTSIPLHTMPRWRAVAVEQIRAIGLMTRKGAIALVALLAVAFAVSVQASLRARDVELRHHNHVVQSAPVPQAAYFFAIVAALYAFVMWRESDTRQRDYFWMMPVDPRVHTLTKVLAGWLWILGISALWLVSMAAMTALRSAITVNSNLDVVVAWWVWLVPITSATIAYALVSSAAIGTRQPLLWVGGVILLYAGVLLALDVLGYRQAYGVVATAFTGEYGITTALFGTIERLDTRRLSMSPSFGRWLGASALWGGASLLLLIETACRRAEPAVVGGHGPFRRAISRHAWLVTSAIVLSVIAGVVATRVMKPEYEAKATIWSRSEAQRIAVSFAGTNGVSVGQALDRMKSLRIADSVVRELALYVRPDDMADTTLLRSLTVADRFMPGDYRLAVSDSGTRWHLGVEMMNISDAGVVGDSIGRPLGLRWLPERATLARYAGREVRFTVGTPREATAELLSRITVVQPGNSGFVQMSMTDSDPYRAARALNAVGARYIAKVRSPTGAALTLLDSAVAPSAPFKNSPTQLMITWLVVGIVAATALAFAANAIEERARL